VDGGGGVGKKDVLNAWEKCIFRAVKDLIFDQRKYGRELLIDSVDMAEFDPGNDRVQSDFYVIGSVVQGNGRVRIGQQDLEVKGNEILFIPPGTATDIRDAQFDEATFLFFKAGFLDLFYQEELFIYRFAFFHHPDAPYRLSLSPEDFGSIYRLVREIHHEIRSPQIDSEHLLRASLYLALVRMNRRYTESLGYQSLLIDDARMLRIKYRLSQGITARTSVQQLADEMGISRVFLNRLSQKYFGKPVSHLIREHLAGQIRAAVLFSDRDITEIGFAFDFSDTSNFIRYYKRSHGVTPGHHRAEFSN